MGIVAGQLTRITKNADMLGVINRKAMVAGSQPDDEERDNYDTVAYVGRVPVRVIGAAAGGDCVGPSGREDGTAVVVPYGVPFVGTFCEEIKKLRTLCRNLSGHAGSTTRNKTQGYSWACYAAVAVVVFVGICLGLYLLRPPRPTEPPIVTIPPVDCTPETFLQMRQTCADVYKNDPTPSGCGAECTRLSTGMIQNCGQNVTEWPILTRSPALTGQPEQREVYSEALLPTVMVQASEDDPLLSPCPRAFAI